MKIFTRILTVSIFTIALLGIVNVKADIILEPLIIDGASVDYFWTADDVMIPTTYTEKDAEFRGVWVATVYNLNIPLHTSETQYKAAFNSLIDEVKAGNMNAIIFQVRPQNDAFYDSAYAPWSRWLTGTEGVDPGWDVMQWMIDTSHANGIEFHAWLNPYRVANTTSSQTSYINTLHSENFAKINPDLVVSGEVDSANRNPLILNPGEPEVKAYIRDVVTELITLYDVDGIHFDDYFYPYSGISSDTDTYNLYKLPAQTIEDWRRENVNDVVEGVNTDIEAHNLANSKDVRFGISPFGLWGSGIEGYSKTIIGGSNTGPTNMSSYYDQFADSKEWVEQGWVDYICPQVYWEFTHTTAPYADVVDWWAEVVRGTDVDLIIGQAISSAHLYSWNTDEIALQLLYNQKHPEISGTALYSASYLDKAAMTLVNSTQWTTTPLNTWASSPVASPTITLTGTLDVDVYRSDVTVTLSSPDTIEYKIDDGLWQTYTTELLFTEQGNRVIYYKAIDGGGIESLVASENIMIDKVNNDIPVITVTGDMIGDNYLVGAQVSITSTETIWVAINHGSVGEWVEYTGPITLDGTGGYYFRVKSINGEGAESDEVNLLVTTQYACFDDPTSIITGLGTDPYYQNSQITLTGDVNLLFKVNDLPYENYVAPLTFDVEGNYTVYYKNDDECGTEFSVSFIIDQTPPNTPSLTITGDYDGERYYTSVTSLELTKDNPLDTLYYRIHNGSTWSLWEEYTDAVYLNLNATYTFEYYAVDAALNQSVTLDERVRLDMPPTEDNMYVVRDGEIVTYYDSSTNIVLPTTYTEKTEEVRAVWVATVANIDIGLHISEQDYKNKLVFILETMDANNFNTMFFQVRPMNDAFYPSSFAPYSRYLTGIEGQDPGWDVLEFLIDEAHQRGIEVHAWLNPYRVSTGTISKEDQLSLLHDDNFAKQNPDLVLVDSSGKLILNPGENQVQAYLKNVIQEIMANYDIDGIHFDDYFYSYNGMDDSEDSALYEATKLPGQTLDDWRRENINEVIEDIYNLVETHNTLNDKNVKFGISPFGIWLSGGEEGSNTSPYALQSYKDQYADTKKWVEEGWVHYIMPQLYWEFDHSAAPFADLVDWWAELTEVNGVDLIIGQGFYRYDDDTWTDENELLEQLRYISQYDSIVGSSFFSFKTLLSTDSDVLQALDRLNNYYWQSYASFPWASDVEPDPVCEIGAEVIDKECVPIVCPVGEILDGNDCIEITCPVGETLDGNDCVAITCSVGEVLDGNDCVAITCSVGETLEGNDCIAITCDVGEILEGNDCVAITCPVGESLEGNDCVAITCPVGETLEGSDCVAITCDSGFELVDGECTEIEDNNTGTVIAVVAVSTISLGGLFLILRKFLF